MLAGSSLSHVASGVCRSLAKREFKGSQKGYRYRRSNEFLRQFVRRA